MWNNKMRGESCDLAAGWKSVQKADRKGSEKKKSLVNHFNFLGFNICSWAIKILNFMFHVFIQMKKKSDSVENNDQTDGLMRSIV